MKFLRYSRDIALLSLLLVPCADAMAQACDRACLYGFLDRYLAALSDRNPGGLPWADRVRFTENNVALQVGDGLWGSISRRGDYDLRFADIQEGQVGHFGVVYEHGIPAIFTLRMKIEAGRISEVETIVNRFVRNAAFPSPDPEALRDTPILNEIVPPDQRRPRARMISIADGYFDTLQLNDGTLFTDIDPNCNRIENGVQTTNNESATNIRDTFRMGCEEQFRLGLYRYDDRLRARRFPLVDEERGLVLAAAFIDHSGRLDRIPLTNGTVRESNYKSPHSFCVFELFKIVNGRIRQVEASFFTVPYHMPSPWLE